MDVDILQVGQNFAANPVGQGQARAIDPAQEGANQNEQSKVEQTDKVARETADTRDTLNSNSLNIESAVAEISEFVQSTNRSLSFSIDEQSQRSVVKVTDSESGDVIRQIPSEEVLALSERIKELQTDVGAAVGVLFNKQV